MFQDTDSIELTHPGEMLREDFLEPMGLSAYHLPKAIGVQLKKRVEAEGVATGESSGCVEAIKQRRMDHRPAKRLSSATGASRKARTCHSCGAAQFRFTIRYADKHLHAGRVGETMKNYVAVLEPGPNNWSAYVPDLPGCVAAGVTHEETEQLIQEAMKFHIEGLLMDGIALPEPQFHGEGSSIAGASVS